jgi:hypothetical protein
MNRDLVNRALLNVGQEPLTDEDVTGKNVNYVLCRNYYIDTFLEALSEVEWTGGRKREKLFPTRGPVLKNPGYPFAYDLPFDCAKPVELQDNAFFVIEGRLLYTDLAGARLLYVSNGKILPPVKAVRAGRPGTFPDMEYLSAGSPGDMPGVVIRAGRPKDAAGIPSPLPEGGGAGEDFPGYRLLDYEPKFYEYVEKTLSARFAMKLSDRPELHLQLLQEAMLVKREAASASMSRAAAKRKPAAWWTEEM